MQSGIEHLTNEFKRSKTYALDHLRRNRSRRSLPYLLRTYASSLCSDPYDRIYGLRGLVEDLDLGHDLTVDYGLSSIQLFEQVTRTYPPQYAQDVGGPLCNALGLDNIRKSFVSEQPEYTTAVRLKASGIITMGEAPLPDPHTHILTQKCMWSTNETLMEGDNLCSFSPMYSVLAEGSPQILVAVRRDTTSIAAFTASADLARIFYTVIELYILTKPDGKAQQPRHASTRTWQNAEAYKEQTADGDDRIVLKLRTQDFLSIKEHFGFARSPTNRTDPADRHTMCDPVSWGDREDDQCTWSWGVGPSVTTLGNIRPEDTRYSVVWNTLV